MPNLPTDTVSATQGTQWSKPASLVRNSRPPSTRLTAAGPGTEGGGGAGPAPPQISYQTGINAERPAINASSVLDRAGKEGRLAGGASGAAKDFLKGTQMGDAAELNRGIKMENAQQNMAAQANRSELFQAGVAQQADMYGKLAQHKANQASMAVEWFQQMMQAREALMQSLMKPKA